MVFNLDFFLLAVPIAGAFFFQALTGMGGGLIAIPILSLFFSPHHVIPIVAIFQLLMGVLILPAPVRRKVDYSILRDGALFVLFGTLAGAFLLTVVPEQWVRILLGASILSDLLNQRYQLLKRPILQGKAILLLGALMSGMFGIGGPLFVMYLRGLQLEVLNFRATILALFVVSNLVRFPGFYLSGLLTSEVLQKGLQVMPFFVVALFVGHKCSKRMSGAQFHKLLQVFLLIAGISLLGRAFFDAIR